MKHLVFVLAIVFAASLYSCGTSDKTNVQEVDSTAIVDSAVVDTTMVDTTVVDSL